MITLRRARNERDIGSIAYICRSSSSNAEDLSVTASRIRRRFVLRDTCFHLAEEGPATLGYIHSGKSAFDPLQLEVYSFALDPRLNEVDRRYFVAEHLFLVVQAHWETIAGFMRERNPTSITCKASGASQQTRALLDNLGYVLDEDLLWVKDLTQSL